MNAKVAARHKRNKKTATQKPHNPQKPHSPA